MICLSFGLITLLTGFNASGYNKIEWLLTMSTNYQQVEKSVMLIKHHNSIIMRIPSISPLHAEDLRRIPMSSGYGRRLHPILNEYKHHSGIDLPGRSGDKVFATANGIVMATGEEKNIGKYIRIRHSYGFTTVYGHLHTILVAKSDTVRIGQTIGLVGSTGRSTGPHLHYGIKKNGKEQNPLPYCYLYLRWQQALMREGKK